MKKNRVKVHDGKVLTRYIMSFFFIPGSNRSQKLQIHRGIPRGHAEENSFKGLV